MEENEQEQKHSNNRQKKSQAFLKKRPETNWNFKVVLTVGI